MGNAVRQVNKRLCEVPLPIFPIIYRNDTCMKSKPHACPHIHV